MMMFRPNKGSTAETVFDAIQSDCFVALEKFGQAEADAWQERIAVDVEYVPGPRGGTIVVRSRPGQPPRRETGKLWESVGQDTEADAHEITMTVGSDVEYARYLQEGTPIMAPRPHVPDLDEFVEHALDAVVAAIEGL